MIDFSDYLDALDDEDEFAERPVPIEEFVTSKDFLNFPPLSRNQLQIVKIGSQIYKESTLRKLYGELEGKKLWHNRVKEVILPLGKGSGKDAMSQIICCYIVYQLLCLKNPARYFGKPDEDMIDIVNVAINAKQAKDVFFAGLKTRVKLCKWFKGKYKDHIADIEFIHNIKIHSLNSEGEGTEGLNILVAVLDEIDGFDEGLEHPNAEAMYKTLSGTVSSRFDETGKVLLLSFPRRTDGFMMKHYESNIAEKVIVHKTHTFILNEDLPEDAPGNQLTINWTEDEIISYKFSKVWALRRPTWEVNPTKTIESYKMDFYRDVDDALGRFACCPTDNSDGGWFKNKAKIDETFSEQNGLTEATGNPTLLLKPDKTKEYFIHVDLARVLDNCAVAMTHVDHFVDTPYGELPFVVVDLVRYWKPDRARPIDFADVRGFVVFLKRAGFNIQKVTFDRWNSDQTIEFLNDVGIDAEKLSVGPDHYTEFALLMGQGLVRGPAEELLIRELKRLVVLPNGKVDHLSKESKDLSDAVCGAIFNASVLTDRDDKEIEILDYSDFVKMEREKELERSRNVIKAPPGQVPDEIADFLDGLTIL